MFFVIRTLLVLSLAFAVPCWIAYFVFAERLLREVRRDHPAQWESAGRPTFLSVVVWGRDYWRPVSADNFFRYRRYASLPDDDLIRRAERVRRLQSITSGIVILWVVLACLVVILDR